MDTKKIAQMTSRYESGVITACEWANSLLYDLVSAPELDTAFVLSLESVPLEVGQEFRRLLARIAGADFHWTPFFLTSAPAPSDPTKYSSQLRRIWDSLEQGRINGEASRHNEPANPKAIEAYHAG